MTASTAFISITLFLCAVCFPEETYLVAMKIGLELELMHLNWKLRRMQWKLYKQLQRAHKERGWAPLPPFKFVRIQDRARK
ncbi:hypothetical protein SynSYN20_01596 [Synechococcus sp. SYN20]|uniref:hypothetical protein n=1 Tax=Synechococcus sp. SYN20 TaxID=1050714 RepID=UPI0016455916|nr:hypothetical protein [Synechococcus sp. SYN20]QNJ25923.1 hypothetical protein SynSYN20_01596 [Synechococcus sp. SYN20]